MDNYNSPGAFAAPSCAGCGAGEASLMPDIASYSYMNPIQKQQQKQQFAPGQQSTGSSMVPASPALPTLEDIAGFNNMSPVQQQQQKQMLEQGSQTFPGTPGQQLSRNHALPGMPGMTPTPTATESSLLAPITPTTQPMSITADSLQYLNGFIRTQIGRPVKVDFLIGTNTMLDKAGILLGVGVNYILLLESETDDVVACDFYNIKFIKFYY